MMEIETTSSHRLCASSLALLSGAKLFSHLLFTSGYGLHRDELYYLACSRHLAPGYVDLGPAIAWMLRVSTLALGEGPLGIRLPGFVAAAGLVFVCGWIAYEVGGSKRAQVVAAATAATSPFFLACHSIVSPATFDQLFWAVLVALWARTLRRGIAAPGIAFGAVIGIGLLFKPIIAVLAIAVGISGVTARRQITGGVCALLRAALLASLIFLPVLLWQISEDWPLLEFIRNNAARRSPRASVFTFLLGHVLASGPGSWILFALGLTSLFRKAQRPLLLVYVSCVVILALLHAKFYYLAPLYPLLWGTGSVSLVKERRSQLLCGLVIGGNLLFAPLALAALPASLVRDWQTYRVNPVLPSCFGWEESTRRVAAVRDSLSDADLEGLVILTQNYGQAAAVDHYGPQWLLPKACSPHNQYHRWGPAAGSWSVVIAIGFDEEELAPHFQTVRAVGTIDNEHGIPTRESGKAIHLCRTLRTDLERAWSRWRRIE